MSKYTKWLVNLFAVGVLLFLAIVPRSAIALEVGYRAPDFSLQASDGNTYSLGQFLKKKPVVIAFFPKAFTSGWTLQCKSLRDSAREIRKYDVIYFMASVDSLEDNKAFAKANGADYPILSDPSKEMARAYGVLGGSGLNRRWTYYIDTDGILVKIDKDINARTAGADIARTLGQLNFMRK